MIQIEDGIPLPSNARGRRESYPWADLGLTESFFAPGANRGSMHSACQRAGKRYGRRFISRPATKDGVEGVRVWRVQ